MGELWELVMAREAWHAAIHGVTKSWTRLNWAELRNYKLLGTEPDLTILRCRHCAVTEQTFNRHWLNYFSPFTQKHVVHGCAPICAKKKKKQRNKKPSESILYLHSAFWMRKHLTFIGSFSSVTALMVGRAAVHCPFPREGEWVLRCSAGDEGDAAPCGWAKGGAGGNPQRLFFLLFPGNSRKRVGKVNQNLAIMPWMIPGPSSVLQEHHLTDPQGCSFLCNGS